MAYNDINWEDALTQFATKRTADGTAPAPAPAPAPQPDFRDYLQQRDISLWDIDAVAQAGQDFAAGRPANPSITNPNTGGRLRRPPEPTVRPPPR